MDHGLWTESRIFAPDPITTSMFENRITQLFGIQYPIVQAGMIWASGWRLASAVSNAGALGLLGAGSMYPEVLREHIQKCKAATDRPFGVNVPLLYPDLEQHIQTIIDEGVKIVFTSAGNHHTNQRFFALAVEHPPGHFAFLGRFFAMPGRGVGFGGQ